MDIDKHNYWENILIPNCPNTLDLPLLVSPPAAGQFRPGLPALKPRLSPVKIIFDMALLRENVSKLSLVVFCTACGITISAFVFLNAAQAWTLLDLLAFRQQQHAVGDMLGTLAMADELTAMASTLAWGVIADSVHRGYLFAAGLALMAIATATTPYATCPYHGDSLSSFFSSLLAMRMLFAVGAGAAVDMMTAVAGDYAAEGCRARLGGLIGISTGFGALLAAAVFNKLPVWLSRTSFPIHAACVITSSAIMAVAICCATCMSRVRCPLRTTLNFPQRLAIGFKAAKHPLVLLAYLSGVVARSDSVALNIFLTPWISKAMPDLDATQVKLRASHFLRVSHLFTLLGAPLFGAFADRLGAVESVAVSALLGFLAYSVMPTSPDSALMYPLMIVCGLAGIGMVITSMSLVTSLSPTHLRGILASVYSFFGALGIIATAKLGGMLFDAVEPVAAFWTVAAGNVGVLVVCVVVLAWKAWGWRALGPPPLFSRKLLKYDVSVKEGNNAVNAPISAGPEEPDITTSNIESAGSEATAEEKV